MNMKTAIVTGASRGIGRAISEALANNGYTVIGLSRNIEAGGPFAMTIKCDVAELEGHQGIVDQVMEKYGRIDVLVNNAGVAPIERVDVLEAGEESYDRLMNINLKGPFFLSQKVATAMIKSKAVLDDYQPKIVFITSVSAAASSPERAEYCISKAGLSMAAQVFADRLSHEDISVYEIRPGIILTDMTSGVKEKYDKRIADGLVPQGRWGKPEDIARGVLSLVSGGVPYTTGSIIELSGGMNIRHL